MLGLPGPQHCQFCWSWNITGHGIFQFILCVHTKSHLVIPVTKTFRLWCPPSERLMQDIWQVLLDMIGRHRHVLMLNVTNQWNTAGVRSIFRFSTSGQTIFQAGEPASQTVFTPSGVQLQAYRMRQDSGCPECPKPQRRAHTATATFTPAVCLLRHGPYSASSQEGSQV